MKHKRRATCKNSKFCNASKSLAKREKLDKHTQNLRDLDDARFGRCEHFRNPRIRAVAKCNSKFLTRLSNRCGHFTGGGLVAFSVKLRHLHMGVTQHHPDRLNAE